MASIFDKEILTKQDLERIDRLGKLWTETKDPDKKAEYHKMAESIRQGYGDSGGADGHGFEDVNKTVISTATAANNLNSALMSAKQAANGDIALKKAGSSSLALGFIPFLCYAVFPIIFFLGSLFI